MAMSLGKRPVLLKKVVSSFKMSKMSEDFLDKVWVKGHPDTMGNIGKVVCSFTSITLGIALKSAGPKV